MRADDILARLARGELAGARSLDLSGCGLTALPPEVLGLADTLEVLDLGRNALGGLPHGFSRLRRLRVLFGSAAAFRVLPPVLGECVALRQVGFRGSGVEVVPAESLPPGLRWLTLTDNRIEALPEAIGARPALQKLMLSGNRIARLPDSLAGAGALELLRLGSNRFEALPGFLGALPRLAWLGFAGNPVEGAAPAVAARVVPWASLRPGALLGEGASGRVHAATWVAGVGVGAGGAGGPDAGGLGGGEAGETGAGAGGPGAAGIAFKLFKGAMTSDGLPGREMEAALAVGAHPSLLGGLGRVEGHPGGACLLMPRLPPGWRALAGPPSPESCSRDVYDPALALPAGAAGRIARGIAGAGAHLRAAGLLHGDLYAHNIHWDGTRGEAVLGDFGAASRYPVGGGFEALDVLAWGILAGELLDRAPAGEANPALGRLRGAATDPSPAARPGFAEIVRAMA